jgi:hypothetical protein
MSLVELMLATSLWGVGFLGALGLFTTCRGAVVTANNILAATNIAQTQIESLKFANFKDVTTLAEQSVLVRSTFNGTAIMNRFYYTVTVTELLGGTVKDVIVEVAWQEKGYNSSSRTQWRSIKMESMITE